MSSCVNIWHLVHFLELVKMAFRKKKEFHRSKDSDFEIPNGMDSWSVNDTKDLFFPLLSA